LVKTYTLNVLQLTHSRAFAIGSFQIEIFSNSQTVKHVYSRVRVLFAVMLADSVCGSEIVGSAMLMDMVGEVKEGKSIKKRKAEGEAVSPLEETLTKKKKAKTDRKVSFSKPLVCACVCWSCF
jgi:hypothetical protein